MYDGADEYDMRRDDIACGIIRGNPNFEPDRERKRNEPDLFENYDNWKLSEPRSDFSSKND